MTTRARIPALDSLRGIAILMVLATHLTVWKPATGWGTALYMVLDSGWLGVDLFFVLSGYLITGILLETRGAEGYYSRFYFRRFLRIFPPYYVVLALLALIGVPVSWHYWVYLSNFYIPTLGSWSAVPYTGHLWSLALEEQWYLLAPLVVAVASRRVLVVTLATIAVASWSVRAVGIQYGHPDLFSLVRVDPLAVGAMLAVWRGRRVHLAVPVAIGAVAVLAQSRDVFYLTMLATFAVAVSRCATTQRTGPVWLQYTGRVSYTMYLVHLPVSVGIQAIVPVHSFSSQIRHWVIAAAITYAVAALSWRYLESPLLALKRPAPVPTHSPATR